MYPSFRLVEINECSIGNGGCLHNCHNVYGGHVCSCRPGFYLGPDRSSCIGKYLLERPLPLVCPLSCSCSTYPALAIIKSLGRSAYSIHDIEGVRSLTKLRLNFDALNELKFRYNINCLSSEECT